MRVIPIRVPEDHIQKMNDIARNKGLKRAEIYRVAIAEYLGTYSTIPSMKELSRQVDRHEQEISEINKVLLKKGLKE